MTFMEFWNSETTMVLIVSLSVFGVFYVIGNDKEARAKRLEVPQLPNTLALRETEDKT